MSGLTGGYRTGRRRRRKLAGAAFRAAAVGATLLGVAVLLALLIDVFSKGAPLVDWSFLTNYASRFPEKSGVRAALLGTVWLLGLTVLVAFPIAVGAAIYLEEYAPRTWLTRLIQINIANLAGVPSIVYGLLGLLVFVRFAGLGRSLLAGALTMSLLVLPLVIVAAREAIRAVPSSQREGALALGATRWQMVYRTVLPAALPGILTGAILSLARAIGETAPLIAIGALTYIAFDPQGPLDLFTVLPIQIFNWVSLPQPEFHRVAAAGIVVLLVILVLANSVAVLLRIRFERKTRW